MSGNTVLSIDDHPAMDETRPVYYFDFAPVLERSRALRQHPERVQLMCENCVRRLAPGDIMLAESSGFFLIVHSAEGSAAEALVHEINIALLELFFGTDALSQNLGSICRRATLQEINDKGITIPPPTKILRPSALDQVEADPLARLAAGGLPGYDGLATGFVPLINLQRDSNALFLCGAVRKHKDKTLFGAAALSQTNPQDRASLDEAILEYSLSIARTMVPTKSASAIVTSVNYETLAWSRGRQIYQKALRAADAANNPFLLVKIEGVPAGTPATRLAEIISMVRPFVSRMFVEVSDWDQGLLRSGHLGVAGFMTALPDDASLIQAGRVMSNLAQLASAQSAVACIANIGSSNQLAMARTAGIRFAAHSVRGGNYQTDLSPPENHTARAA